MHRNHAAHGQRRALSRRLLAVVGAVAVAAASVAAIAGSSSSAGAATAAGRGGSRAPADHRKGQAAVDALGGRLPDIASRMGVSVDEVRTTLLTDPGTSVDPRGELVVTDAAEPAEALSRESAATWPSTPAFPTSTTFTLHSRAESKRKIYLDFTGHIMSGTKWNRSLDQKTIVLADFDVDGDPSSFSDREHAIIQNAWLSVREDFTGFDVDITTEYPGSTDLMKTSDTDEYYGQRVVITSTNFENCSCGGAAYFGTFEGSDGTPAYVLNKSSKTVAEAISHEVGHTLWLKHDGTSTEEYYEGHGDWAPIMGSGYGRRVTQWSKGEYTDADNTQDDLEVMRDNGLSGGVPDRGNLTITASTLALGAMVTGDPINTTGDVDAWKVTVKMPRTLRVFVTNYYGNRVDSNLNVRIRLYNSSGRLLQTISPTETMSATLSRSVGSGDYYVYVDGVGEGSPLDTGYSKYGSFGRYNITMS